MLRYLLLAVLAFNPVAAWADIESGPKAEEKAPAMKAFGVVGSAENKETDYTKDRGEAPTIYVFINADKFSRPIARFIKELDGQVTKASDKAAVVTVWIGGDTDKNKEYLPKVQTSIKLENTSMAVYTGEASGPKDWAINPDAQATVVVVNKGKVVKSYAYDSLNDTEVKKVMETLTTAVKK